jgi:3-oxoacyl-[acyl-carrier protein] reductase/meso-butanediol dehydrogenase/(S,S)-butanediol dehydrogenase/diacetyl reductase
MYDNITMEKDKVVIITGGNKGIGLGITKKFLDAGYIVVVGAREDNFLKLGKNFFFKATDVRKEEDLIKLVAFVIKKFGRLDCIVNNAGYSEWKPISLIDDDFLTNIINTNLKGVFWGCKSALPFLNIGTSIINISSLAGKRGSSNNSAYAATKFGVNGLTQSLSKELGPKGIRVNAVCPVLIATKGLNQALSMEYAPGNKNPEKFIEDFTKSNSALLRMPLSSEVGDMCVFLASDKASAITGQCINVDCGVLPQ